jgi:hypothetical protein
MIMRALGWRPKSAKHYLVKAGYEYEKINTINMNTVQKLTLEAAIEAFARHMHWNSDFKRRKL